MQPLVLHPALQALERQLKPTPLMQIIDPQLKPYQVELWIKRDDLLHPVISGNKWRKLKYILNHALVNHAECLLSMGGAYSNHLHAMAYAGQALGLKTAAFVRGEEPARLNPTLQDLKNWQMDLRFVSRSDYRQLREYKTHDGLPGLQAGEYWLPEGGACDLALLGVAEILAEIDMAYDVLALACGTGTTLAGIIAEAPETRLTLGVAALKSAGFLVYDVQQLLKACGKDLSNWQIALDYHFGGFAKTNLALLSFIEEFQAQHHIPLEPVYTGKLMYALYDLIKQGHFPAGQRILALHTGGLQGNRNAELMPTAS